MAGMRTTLPYLIIAAVFHQTIALKCNTGCVGSSGNVFNYQPGTVYKYELDGASVMSLAGADGDAAKMTVKALADVTALPDCGFSVSLTSFQVADKDGKTSDGEKGQPVVFSMNNGVIQSDICTAKDEPSDALNIKRAIVSLLQSGSKSTSRTETDIFGTCPTDIQVHKSGPKHKVKKTKNLTNCGHRQNILVPFSVTHYHSASDLQSLPWVSASQHVEQDVEGQVKWALSKEEYVMPPATGGETGATVTVTTKLSLKGTGGGGVPPTGIDKEKTILLGVKEHTGEDQAKNAGGLLKKICEGAQGEMGKDNAKWYAYLSYVLSRSSKATMTTLFSQIKQGQICADKETAKKVLLDAIYDSQSAEGVQAMAELLKNKEVTGLKAQMWYSSLGYVKHATIPSLKAVAGMVDGDAPIEAYLGVGNLLGRYCHQHTCEGVPEVNQLQKKLSGPLAKGCKPETIAEEDKLIASIKGLGNSEFLSGGVTKQLLQCASDTSARSRVRAASLDALLADPNKEIIKKTAITLLKDKNEDAEIRIKAYLIIASCPCGKMAGIIKDVLDKEESFQVGNFIVSHLRNIRSSKNPDKAKAQAHFSAIQTSKSFPFDIRKFSTNMESSYMLESLNVGSSVESNLIYSQKSWIPKSVCLNITSHLFGNSFNILEMDVRAENLERLVEKLAGPKGYMSHEPEDIGNDVNTFFSTASARARQTFRPKRGASQNDIDSLAKQVNLGADFGESDESLDLSLKMFGSEIAWIPLHGAKLDRTPSESVNEGFDLLDKILNKAKNIDMDYTKHAILGEGVVAYPTAMGVPLKVKGVSSLALRVKMDGKLDLPAILRDPKNALVKFQIIPSGAASVSVISMMEAAGLNTGLKVTATAHSSTGSDVTVRLLEGKGIDVKVGLPLAKQEVLNLNTEIISFSDSVEGKNVKPVTFNSKREEYSGCFDQVSEFLGLTFCGEISTPWDGARIISPAYGPTSLSARIEKEDPSLTSFHFKAFVNQQKDAPQNHFEIVLDTPNSKKERRLGIVIDNTVNPHLGLKAVVDSPFGNLKLDTSAINNAAEKSVNAELIVVDQEYLFKAGVKQAGGNKYKPFLEYKAPEGPKSRFAALAGGKADQQQISVSGDIEVQGNKLILQGVKVTLARQDYLVDGSLWDEPKQKGVDLKVTTPDDVIAVKAIRDTLSPTHTKRQLSVSSNKYPDVSISSTWDLEIVQSKKENKVKSDIVVVHGPDPASETSRVSLSNFFHSVQDPKGVPRKVEAKNSVTYPIVNLKGVVDFHGDAEKLGYDLKGSFETYSAGSHLDVLLSKEYTVDFATNIMDNKVVVHMKRDKAGDHQSKFTNTLEANPGGKYELVADVTHKFEPEDVDALVSAKITLPNEPKNIDFKAGVKDNTLSHESVISANVDGKNLIDGQTTISKGTDVSGNFKLVLPGFIDSNGDLKFGPNGADGKAVINFLKANKKVEAKTHVAINSPTLKGTTDLCLDSKCVKFSTDTTIEKDTYDSKSKIELPAGLTFSLNAKGDQPKGSHTGDAELKTSSGHQTKMTYSSVRHMRPGDADVEYIGTVEDVSPGSKPFKFEAKLVGKHIDIDKQTGDGQILLTYHTPEGKDLSFHNNFKRAPSGDKWISNNEVGLSGSLITTPVTLKFDSELDNKYFDIEIDDDDTIPPASYQLKLDVGTLLSVESHGKGAGHTVSNELHVTLPEAKEGIKNFKWSTNNMVDLLADDAKMKSSNTIKWDGKFIKTNMEVNEEGNGVNFSLDLEGDSIPKKTLTGNSHYCDLTESSSHCNSDGSLALTWDGKKADVAYTSEMDFSKKFSQLNLKGTMLDGTKFDITTKGKCNNKGDKDVDLEGEVTAIIGDKKWAGTAAVDIDKDHRNVDFVLNHPEGGKSQFKSHNFKKGEMHWTSEQAVQWVSNGGGSMVGDMDINVENENDFSIVYNLDAPVMNMNKFHFGAKVTPDKKFDLDIKNNGKTVAAAKTSYEFTSEGTKKKIEGAGNVNIDGKDYPLSYDATFDVVPEVKTLLQMDINAKAGDRTFTFKSEGKPNHVHMKRTYCKAPGDCSEAEILYDSKFTDPTNYEQNFKYKLDFSLFNPTLKDLNINSKIKNEGLSYSQNSNFDWGDSKVTYSAFIQPNKAGASLVLPQRTLAAETAFSMPKKDKNAVKLEGSVWLDKAKSPNKRTHLVVLGEVGLTKDLYTAQGEVRFNNPGLPKPLSIKGKTAISNSLENPSGEGSFEVDIFKKPKMKIIGNWKMVGKQTGEGAYEGSNMVRIKSEDLKININLEQKVSVNKESATAVEKLSYVNAKGETKEANGKFELTPKKLHLVLSTTDVLVVDYLAKWDLTESTLVASEALDMLGAKYSDHLEVHLKPLHLKYKFINNQGCDSKDFTLDANFEMGKSTKLDVGFGGSSILSGEVSLAEGSFLKPTASYDKNAITALRDCYSKSNKFVHEELEKLVHRVAPNLEAEVKARSTMLGEAGIDWQGVIQAYREEVDKIQEEILADKNIQGVAAAIKETLSALLENVAQSLEQVQEFYVQTSTELKQTIDSLMKTINELSPILQKSFAEILDATNHLAMDLATLLTDLTDAAIKEIAAHSDEINALFKSMGDICEEYGKFLYKFAHQLHDDIQAFSEEISAKLQEFPLTELISEQIELLKGTFEGGEWGLDESVIKEIAQDFVGVLEDGLKQLKETKAFPDLETLIETIITWIKKTLDKEPVDNVDYTKKIAQQAYEVVKHLIEMLQEHLHVVTSDDPLSKARFPTLSSLPLNKIPTGLLKLSGLSWITSSDLPSLIQVIATYLPAMNPEDWTPPFVARAYLLGGSEIITFDGAHLSVGGDCSYVLTQDYLDGNFSVVAQFKGGKLDAIQVSDGTDSVELRHGLKPVVNGKESEFPIFQGQIRSWKRAAVVGLATKSGLKILCTPDCLRCKFRVDGLYFGRLRGLLGTYNYEQYDELTLPSGEIADSADKFLSSWAVGGGCAAQSPAAAAREATCTKTFTDATDFLACYHLVSPKPYRRACDSLAAKETTPEGLQAAVCNVAFAYSLQCQTRIPTAVPTSCLKCAETKTNIFETSAVVEPPFKKADVVFTVERFHKNQDIFNTLVKPLIQTVKADLAAKGISDVKFGLVGFGGKKRMWPAYYTNNLQILSDDIEEGNLSFDPDLEKKGIKSMVEDVAAESGVTGKSMTYLDLVEFYPWRIGSSKVVIGIHATPCKESHTFFLLQHLYYISSYLNKGITFHTVSPVKDLELPGGDASKVVAISGDEVFSASHAAQSPLEGHGDKEAEDKIQYKNDVCFTFAHMTGGYVFPAENYAGQKDAFQKILKTSVVESLTNPAKQHTQKCSCHPLTNPYDGIFSQPDCRVINL